MSGRVWCFQERRRCTCIAALHLHVEPQAVLGSVAVLTDMHVIVQPIVGRPDKVYVSPLKVATESQLVGLSLGRPADIYGKV